MGWQPIETAPKDWSAILLYEEDANRNNEVGEGYFAPSTYGGDDCWRWTCTERANPSHWMPLPKPPTEDE